MNGPFTKTNVALVVAFAVQLVALVAINAASDKPETRSKDDAAVAGSKPFASLDVKNVTAIACKKRESAGIRLEKETKKDGDKETTSWVIADRDRAPAKASESERLIESLKKITLNRVITRQPKRYAGLNVSDDAADLRVTVYGAGGAVLADVYVGEARDFSSIQLRKAGDDAVYGATGAALYDFGAEAQSVAEQEFLKLDLAKIVGFKVVNETGTYEAAKETPASQPTSRPESQPESAPAVAPAPYWITKGEKAEKLDLNKVETWLRGVAALNLSEPVGRERKPEYGLDKPTATLVLRTDDGKETTVTIGAERKDQYDWYAAATGVERVVTVKAYNVTDWFKKPLKDLLPTAPGSDG